jgi:hypothetical protein
VETYLSVVNLAGAEQCIQRIITRYQKPGKVDQKAAGNVKEDEEEI